MGDSVPALVRRAEADRGAAGDQRRAVLRLRLLQRGLDLPGLWPSMAIVSPARGLEALELVGAGGLRGRAVDRDPVVVPHHDQLRELEMAGQIDRLVADALHQAAVAGDDVSVMIDESRRSARQQRSAIAMPTDIARPWPSGPVVASTPSVWPYSGWPGGLRAELAETLDLLDRHIGIAE